MPKPAAANGPRPLQTLPCQDCGPPTASIPRPRIASASGSPRRKSGASQGIPRQPGQWIDDPEAVWPDADWLDDLGPYDPRSEEDRWFPNRPYLIPRTADRLRQRPLFPNRPFLLGPWSGGPHSEQPRSFWFNPFALQQGVGNFLFRGNHPADTGSLGFPFSLVPSHWVDRVPRPYLGHGQSYVGPRHIERGQPLVGTSWVNRPYYVDGYTGAWLARRLANDLDQTNGTISGLRVGWDFDHFWGTQINLGFGSSRLDPFGDSVAIRLADVAVLYYPWGDARWRPYTGVGLGVGKFTFLDQDFRAINQFGAQIPLSLGVKYAFQPWWGLRLDATNYLSLPANDLRFMNNLALTIAAELRFGGRRRSYFPYSPSIHLH